MAKLIEVDGHYLDPNEVVVITKTYLSEGLSGPWVYFIVHLRSGVTLRIEREVIEQVGEAKTDRATRINNLATVLGPFRVAIVKACNGRAVVKKGKSHECGAPTKPS